MSATVRGSKLQWFCGVGEGLPRKPGLCAWCGQPIDLADPTDYRRAKRTRHRGDEHEVGGGNGFDTPPGRNCQREYNRSTVWNARALVILRGDPCCVDCGQTDCYWEADHRIPLCDGGSHDPTNIERRCEKCHARKTAAEAKLRAERRRFGSPVAATLSTQQQLVAA